MPKRVNISFVGDLDNEFKDQLILIIKSQTKTKKVNFEIVEIDHPLLDYIRSNYEWIPKKVKLPTPEQCEYLVKTYKNTSIKACLDQLENKQYKDHKTVYFTLRTWMNKDTSNLRDKSKDIVPKPEPIKIVESKETEKIKNEFFEKWKKENKVIG